MVSYPRAELADVRIGSLTFEGLMLEDGTFGIAVSQACILFQISINHASRDLKALLCNNFQFSKFRSKLHPKAVNVLLLKDFELVVFELALKRNDIAIEFSRTLLGLSLHQLFSDAFCVKFEKEERQVWLDQRKNGKIVRHTLTDAIQDYIKSHDTSENYQKFIYNNVSDAVNRAIFNRRAKDLKEDWGVENPRDGMNQQELQLLSEVENLTTRLIDKDQLEPMTAAKEAISRLCLPTIKR